MFVYYRLFKYYSIDMYNVNFKFKLESLKLVRLNS